MAGCDKVEIQKASEKRMIIRLRKENPDLAAADIRKIAKELSKDVFEKAAKLAVDTAPKASEAVTKNATKDMPKEKPVHVVGEDVIALSKAYEANPDKEAASALLNAETAAGMRNADGDLIVEPIMPRTKEELKAEVAEHVASGETQNTFEMFDEEVTEFHYDRDGTMSNSQNVNNALKDMDKKNFGENFDEVWSTNLDFILNQITTLVGDINEADLKLLKTTMSKKAEGRLFTVDGKIEIRVDSLDKDTTGQNARNRFTMTNQEVYLHELTHAVINYAFEVDVSKPGANLDVVNFMSEGQRLYNLARKNTSEADMLIGIENPTVHEIKQAGVRYNYIFNNSKGNGLHEFMAHLLTNKQFSEAMAQVDAGIQKSDARTDSRKAKDIADGKGVGRTTPDKDFINKLLDYFRDLLNKILGMVTTTDGSITKAGSNLIVNIMAGNIKAADKTASGQARAISAKAMKVADDLLEKVGEQLDKSDEFIKEPMEKMVSKVLGDLDTTASKVRFTKEYNKQKTRYYLLKGIKTAEGRAAVEEEADKLATKKAKENIEKEREAMHEKLTKATKAYDAAAKERAGKPSIPFIRLLGHMSRIPSQLLLLKRLHATSRGVYGEELAERFAENFKETAERLNFIEGSFFASVLEDFYDKDGLYNEITDAILYLTQNVDGQREFTYEGVLGQTKEWFGDTDIHHKDNIHYDAAMNDTILRADIQALNITAEELAELLDNPKDLQDKIAELSKKLDEQQLRDATSSAAYLATGDGQITNATNIVRGFGKEFRDIKHGRVNKQLVKDVDQLISLMALQKTSIKSKNDMKDFLAGKGFESYSARMDKKLGTRLKFRKDNRMTQEEYTAQVLSGTNNFIAYSRGMQKASAEEMKLEPHNIVKGYMKETYDHDTLIEYFPMDQRKEKENEGYVFVRDVKKTVASDVDYGMFTIRDSRVKRANGALGLQGVGSRGVTLADIINRDSEGLDFAQKGKKFKKVMIFAKDRYESGMKTGMHPIYSKEGNIINFRALMTHKEKYEVLNMESRGTQNLSRSFGTTSNAKVTARHNKGILSKLRKDYDENYVGNESDYVTIQPSELDAEDAYGLMGAVEKTKKDKEYEEMWARLPKSTREAAAEYFGDPKEGGGYTNGKIIVRKDLLTPLFGYDEYSVLQSKMANKWSGKTRQNVRKYELLWQDTMQIAKGNIVIKGTSVLMGNIASNMKILLYIGVNPIKGTKLMLLGQKELRRYEVDKKELAILLRDEMAGIIKKNPKTGEFATANRKKVLQKSIETNSVHELVSAGLYQSVVEDVSTKTDNNRVSNYANEKRDEWVTNEGLNTAIQYAFLTEKTSPFQMLLKATQVSDFYFRYAQYHDSINNKGKSKKEAMRNAIDFYINYEAPLNKHIRYGDRMSPFFFITYFTRIQKVIKRISQAHPARIAVDIMQQFILDNDQDDILDNSIFDANVLQKYNPLKIFRNFWEAVSPSGLEFVGVID